MNVGEKIHNCRKQQKVTLKQLSDKSGVALATLSRMENGKMVGTLDSHIRIAKALGIALPELYSEVVVKEQKVELQAHGATADTFVHDAGKSSIRMLTSKVLSKKMMPIFITIQVGGATHKEESPKGAEKFIYVLEGSLEVIIGKERFELHKQDTLYFDASLPHLFKNIGKVEVNAICVACPPAL